MYTCIMYVYISSNNDDNNGNASIAGLQPLLRAAAEAAAADILQCNML